MSEEWQERLRALDVRPATDVHGAVAEGVRARRRRRAALTGGAATLSIALVIGGVALVTRPGDEQPPADGPGTTSPTVTPPDATTDAGDFRCPQKHPLRDDAVLPPLIQEYKRIYSEVTAATFDDDFGIDTVEVTHYGVIVLVTGDVAAARRELNPYGVSGVALRDPAMQSAVQITAMLDGRLRTVREQAIAVGAALEGVGGAGFRSWPDEGAVLVQWKRPVPAEVLALADVRFPRGGFVVVEEVAHAQLDIDVAQRFVGAAFHAGEVLGTEAGAAPPVTRPCADYSGLIVEVDPDLLPQHRGALQEELSVIAEMPVMVVPQRG